MKKIKVAIDGPAAAGKSTVAKLVADQCAYIYIDTGAMYRAVTYMALQQQASVEDERALLRILSEIDIVLRPDQDGQKVYINGQDVTRQIRSREVTNHVSFVARHKQVREELVERQRKLAQAGGVVMDGRDIGTHVLPHAEVKVFLLATAEERAMRRHKENVQNGDPSNLEQLIEEIAERDRIDMNREVSPLKKAEDAIEIDTTSLTIAEVAEKILQLVKERARI